MIFSVRRNPRCSRHLTTLPAGSKLPLPSGPADRSGRRRRDAEVGSGKRGVRERVRVPDRRVVRVKSSRASERLRVYIYESSDVNDDFYFFVLPLASHRGESSYPVGDDPAAHRPPRVRPPRRRRLPLAEVGRGPARNRTPDLGVSPKPSSLVEQRDDVPSLRRIDVFSPPIRFHELSGYSNDSGVHRGDLVVRRRPRRAVSSDERAVSSDGGTDERIRDGARFAGRNTRRLPGNARRRGVTDRHRTAVPRAANDEPHVRRERFAGDDTGQRVEPRAAIVET